VGSGWAFGLALLAPAAILGWQVMTLDGREAGNALARFKANHWVGAALTGALVLEWLI
jgi:4-hydroxybenzoate polyprenyltransferase